MSRFVANKTKPYIYSGKSNPFAEFDTTYWYKSYVMTRKFKGRETAKYVGNRQVELVSSAKVDRRKVIKEFIKQAEKCAKSGRFYDWTFQPEPNRDSAVFIPALRLAPTINNPREGE